MLVLVPSATHIWERVIPGGEVHCHWKEPSSATVQERLAADTTLSSLGRRIGSIEMKVILVVGRDTIEKGESLFHNNLSCNLSTAVCHFVFLSPSHTWQHTQSHMVLSTTHS